MNRDNPFSLRAALALVVLGGLLFVGILWMIGAGLTGGPTNDGGAHAGGKGLNGYAAFASFVEKRGRQVRRVQDAGSLDGTGLLVLTPPADAEGKDIDKIVRARRRIGPTLVITPKWQAVPVPAGVAGARKGWVFLAGVKPPEWRGFQDGIVVSIGAEATRPARWLASGQAGQLPAPGAVMSGRGLGLVPLVATANRRTLAAYVQDDGSYPDLEDHALDAPPPRGADEDLYPVVLVFEPDLLNNSGMARAENARLAEMLVNSLAGDGAPVMFDMTLNGFARSTNLLTLAFTPPFLAATLCLLLAAVAVGWRAFRRFGPPRAAGRAIAFGKRALVANTAALIERSRRLHLVGAPYAAAARDRLAQALAIDRRASSDQTAAAIDRALDSRGGGQPHFSELAGRLAAERDPLRLVAAARQLHALERKLTR